LTDPPELNILIKPIGANFTPFGNSFIGTTVKTSYSHDFMVIGIETSFGRYTTSPAKITA
jgi:hypothetical protein